MEYYQNCILLQAVIFSNLYLCSMFQILHTSLKLSVFLAFASNT